MESNFINAAKYFREAGNESKNNQEKYNFYEGMFNLALGLEDLMKTIGLNIEKE